MKAIISIFFFFCFFPYLDIAGLGTDTQPNAIIFASIILVTIKDKKINMPLVILWLLFFCSPFLYINSDVGLFFYAKNCMNYLSPALVAFAAYTVYIKTGRTISFKAFMAVVFTYMAVGLIQLLIFPEFLTPLVNGGGRGVVSLCPEPAFYGSMCIFLMAFSLICFNKKQNYVTIPVLLFQILFLAQSATALAILGFSVLVFSIIQLLRLKFKYVMSMSMLILLLIPVYSNVSSKLDETRAGQIYNEFIEDPYLITRFDSSVGIRFTGSVAPFLALRYNHLLPSGIGHYKEFLSGLYESGKYRHFLTWYNIQEKDTLGGSVNMVIYQLGLIGLLLPVAIFLFFKRSMYKSSPGILAFLLFMCVLFTQIQLMHSMIGFIMATARYYGNKRIL